MPMPVQREKPVQISLSKLKTYLIPKPSKSEYYAPSDNPSSQLPSSVYTKLNELNSLYDNKCSCGCIKNGFQELWYILKGDQLLWSNCLMDLVDKDPSENGLPNNPDISNKKPQKFNRYTALIKKEEKNNKPPSRKINWK